LANVAIVISLKSFLLLFNDTCLLLHICIIL